MPNPYKQDYQNQKFHYSNTYQTPTLQKVVINRGVGEASQNPRILENIVSELESIAGQKSIITKSKKSISSFKLRQKMPVGAYVTLRSVQMFSFVDRLLNLALPRIRDFQGLSTQSFDGSGNYTFGLEEQLMFPEIEYDQIDHIQGMDITIVTSTQDDLESLHFLRNLGFPFQQMNT